MSPHTIPLESPSGSSLKHIKNTSTACNTGPLGSIFGGQVLKLFAGVLHYKWRVYGELHPLKFSSIGLYPRFWPYTLWIIHDKPLEIVWLASSVCRFSPMDQKNP
jgi:hypothetical protein